MPTRFVFKIAYARLHPGKIVRPAAEAFIRSLSLDCRNLNWTQN